MRNSYQRVLFSVSAFFGLIIFFLVSSFQKSEQDDQDGFVQIFDGKTLNGWEGDSTYWSVQDGAITGVITPETIVKRNTFLIWKGGITTDFELKVEYRISENGNSGINYRSEEVKDIPYALRGYQFDIDGKNNYTGQNYEERGRCIIAYRGQKVMLPNVSGPLQSIVKNNVWNASVVTASLGEADSLAQHISPDWNECHLIVKGNRMQHFVNGILMSDVTDNDSTNRKSSGLLGVQVHVGPPMKVEYRNVRLKKLK